jgi:hypothetical protein
MEYPLDWDVSPMEDFEAYLPDIQSSSLDYIMELLAQLGPQDGSWTFRIALEGSATISQELDLDQLIPSSVFKGHKLAFQYWARDIQIHRNMLSFAWMNVPTLV